MEVIYKMIKQILKCGYDLSDASKEEIQKLLKDTDCKHIWANRETIKHFRAPIWQDGQFYTIVNKIKDGVIFINHWY